MLSIASIIEPPAEILPSLDSRLIARTLLCGAFERLFDAINTRVQVVERGTRHERFREFVVFDGDHVYPEYLLAYKRGKRDGLAL